MTKEIILFFYAALSLGCAIGSIFGWKIGYKRGREDAEEEELKIKFKALTEAARREAYESTTERD